jgi:putative acetyltransferase
MFVQRPTHTGAAEDETDADPAHPRYADYPELVRIWEASVRATHDFLPTPTSICCVSMCCPSTWMPMLVCCKDRDRRILGFAGVATDLLFVAPEHFGRGVGQRLLRHAVAELNAERLDVNEQNPQALGFYLHEGFEIIGRSATDGLGQPYPLLHMQRGRTP